MLTAEPSRNRAEMLEGGLVVGEGVVLWLQRSEILENEQGRRSLSVYPNDRRDPIRQRHALYNGIKSRRAKQKVAELALRAGALSIQPGAPNLDE